MQTKISISKNTVTMITELGTSTWKFENEDDAKELFRLLILSEYVDNRIFDLYEKAYF